VSSKGLALLKRCTDFLHREARQFITVKNVRRPWLLPIASAAALGGPVLLGAYAQQLNAGLTASLGGLVFLYLPATAPWREGLRSLLTTCGAMLAFCAIGLAASTVTLLQVPALTLLTVLATLYCRRFSLGGPPGSLFLVIAASVAASSHAPLAQWLSRLGLIALGCLWGVAMAGVYSLLTPTASPAKDTQPPGGAVTGHLRPAVSIGAVVGLSLLAAQLLSLNNPWWVPVSCLAVIQGGSLREIWSRQLHRMVGTAAGLLWVSTLFNIPLSEWQVAGWIVLLSFAIELTVTRHYATAVMFITPMTILLADAGQAHQTSLWSLAQSRLLDTMLGCLIGLLGGVWLHRRS
jgi:hypothetical protein